MKKQIYKFISLFLCFLLCFEQSSFAQVAVELNIAGHLSALHNSLVLDNFRPIHLRYLQYDSQANNFQLLLDKGDSFSPSRGHFPPSGGDIFRQSVNESFNRKVSPVYGKESVPEQEDILKKETQTLLNYFLIGLTLPNDAFWVNLRPDSPDQIIDDKLAKTDIGKIMLETDLQLKKDTASATSPQTPEGKEYWDKLYKKAEELYGTENVTIPTLTRPWIVPGEIIVRETADGSQVTGHTSQVNPSAYIYKATLKVMLEEDYLTSGGDIFRQSVNEVENRKVSPVTSSYSFPDERAKTLNEYSTQLIRELIIPKLTKEVNSSKRYAPLRQVYYSLILAQWFKARAATEGDIFHATGGDIFRQSYNEASNRKVSPVALINSQKLTNLTSKHVWDKNTYFNAYKKSFAEGEYNIQEPVYTPTGQVIRSYFSGGEQLTAASSIMTIIPATGSSALFQDADLIKFSVSSLTQEAITEASASPAAGIDKSSSQQRSASPLSGTTEGSRIDKKTNPWIKIIGFALLTPVTFFLLFLSGRVQMVADTLLTLNKINFYISRHSPIPQTFHVSAPPKITDDKYFQDITRNISKATKHSIGLSIHRLLKRSGLELSPENIRKAGEFIVNMRDSVSSQEIFSASRKIINITNADLRSDLNSLISLESEAGVNLSDISSFKGVTDKQNILNKIENTKDALTIYFEGHGDEEHFWLVSSIFELRESERLDSPSGISYQELGDSLLKKGSLQETVIIIDACYVYNFSVNLLSYLADKGARDLPILIGSSNYKRKSDVYAFYASLKETYQKHNGPLILQHIFDAEDIALLEEDCVVFIPIDRNTSTSIFYPSLLPGQIIESNWSGHTGIIGLPAGALEISYLDFFDVPVFATTFPYPRKNSAVNSAVHLPSTLHPAPSTIGGIDFRSLPIVTQAMTNLSANLGDSSLRGESLPMLNSMDIEEEWRQIEQVSSSGISLSTQRIKEFVQACCLKGKNASRVVALISKILRKQEQSCEPTDLTLLDILAVFESIQNPQALKEIFLGKPT